MNGQVTSVEHGIRGIAVWSRVHQYDMHIRFYVIVHNFLWLTNLRTGICYVTNTRPLDVA